MEKQLRACELVKRGIQAFLRQSRLRCLQHWRLVTVSESLQSSLEDERSEAEALQEAHRQQLVMEKQLRACELVTASLTRIYRSRMLGSMRLWLSLEKTVQH